MPALLRLADLRDVPAMLAIYAPLVRETAITFEYEPPTLEQFEERIETVTAKYPWLVAEDENRIAGFAYAGPHRTRPAYQWSVETSVYVHAECRKGGVGRLLYERLFDLLQIQGFQSAYAGITLPNDASVAFHRALGFEEVGVYRAAGYKLGAWHDAVWYQRQIGEFLQASPSPPLRPADVMHTRAWREVHSADTTD